MRFNRCIEIFLRSVSSLSNLYNLTFLTRFGGGLRGRPGKNSYPSGHLNFEPKILLRNAVNQVQKTLPYLHQKSSQRQRKVGVFPQEASTRPLLRLRLIEVGYPHLKI